MVDTFKELTHLIVDGKLRQGAPRFNTSSLRDVRLKAGKAIFYLDAGKLSIPIEELTMEEGRIIYDYCADDENKQNEDKSFLDYLNYKFFPPSYVIQYSFYGVIVLFCIIGLILAIDYVNDLPVNNDKNEAVSIAMKDPSLQQYIGNKDMHIETVSCFYYDPTTGTTSKNRSGYMDVDMRIWYIPPDGGYTASGQLFDVYMYYIKVDLENKSIISSEHSKVV